MKKGYDILLLLLLCVVAVYFNHFDNSFHFDDSHTIVNNLNIRSLDNIPRFFTDGTTFSSLPANQSYRPVITTLNAIDYALTGQKSSNTFWYHVSIFASFLLTGYLLFLSLEHLLGKISNGKFNTAIALFVTGWFFLHPANAETINYIIARSDSFSTCMLLLAFVMYTRWPLARKNYLYLLPYVVGFLSKETTIMFLPLLFLYELLFTEEKEADSTFSINKIGIVFKKLWAPILVSVALLILYKQMLPASWRSGGVGNEYWLTQPFAILHYVGNFLLPINLVVDTDWEPVDSLVDIRFLIGTAFLVILISLAALLCIRQKYRLIAFGLSWFILALLPTSLVPLAEVINDHRTFFPYIGLFIAVVGLLQWILTKSTRWISNRIYVLSIQVAILLFFVTLASLTWKRNQVWHSENSLWKEVTIKAPNNGRGWMNYGLTQMEKGDYNGAETSFQKSVSLLPAYSYVYINLGILKSLTGYNSEAEEYFKSGIIFDSQNPEAYAWYAEFLINQNRKQEAASLIQKGLLVSPAHEKLNFLNSKLSMQ